MDVSLRDPGGDFPGANFVSTTALCRRLSCFLRSLSFVAFVLGSRVSGVCFALRSGPL